MQVRLQKLIAQAGITSRRKAETLITDGCVTVNGRIVTELGSKADPERDHVKVNGKLLRFEAPSIYLMLNKPAGFITTLNDPEGRPTVMNLVRNVRGRLYPVGRLDYHTEGLLLLTNDGALAHRLMHPSSGVLKRYHAKIKGVVDDDQIARLSRGVKLQDGTTAPCTINKLRLHEKNSWLEVILHEGRYRQVRRMFESIGRSVIKLRRVGYAGLTLGDLPLGQYRRLTPKEVESLRRVAARSTSELPAGESFMNDQAASSGRAADDRSGAQPVTRSSERPARQPSQRPSERPARPVMQSREQLGQRAGGRTAQPSTTRPSDRPHQRRGGAAGWRERAPARQSMRAGGQGPRGESSFSGRPVTGSLSGGRAASGGRQGRERIDHQKARSGGTARPGGRVNQRRGGGSGWQEGRRPGHRTAGPRRGRGRGR
ncbi:MAG: pseudouridine synthase [Nitrospirae bacterium]|nr:pseudouridine synthase [Nitrospirota bacterium]